MSIYGVVTAQAQVEIIIGIAKYGTWSGAATIPMPGVNGNENTLHTLETWNRVLGIAGGGLALAALALEGAPPYRGGDIWDCSCIRNNILY